MKAQTIILFSQDLKNQTEIRLNLINKTITDYFEKEGLSPDKNQTKMIQEAGVKHFYHKDKLIISVQDRFEFNGVSYLIKYWMH